MRGSIDDRARGLDQPLPLLELGGEKLAGACRIAVDDADPRAFERALQVG